MGISGKTAIENNGHLWAYDEISHPNHPTKTFTDFEHPKTPCFQGHQGLLGCGRESGAHPREASEEAAEGADAARCQVGRRRRPRNGPGTSTFSWAKKVNIRSKNWLKTSLMFSDWFYSCW